MTLYNYIHVYETLGQYINLRYPIESSRKAGAKPRNIEVSLDKRPVAENSGRTIEKPARKKFKEYKIKTCIYDARVENVLIIQAGNLGSAAPLRNILYSDINI